MRLLVLRLTDRCGLPGSLRHKATLKCFVLWKAMSTTLDTAAVINKKECSVLWVTGNWEEPSEAGDMQDGTHDDKYLKKPPCLLSAGLKKHWAIPGVKQRGNASSLVKAPCVQNFSDTQGRGQIWQLSICSDTETRKLPAVSFYGRTSNPRCLLRPSARVLQLAAEPRSASAFRLTHPAPSAEVSTRHITPCKPTLALEQAPSTFPFYRQRVWGRAQVKWLSEGPQEHRVVRAALGSCTNLCSKRGCAFSL